MSLQVWGIWTPDAGGTLFSVWGYSLTTVRYAHCAFVKLCDHAVRVLGSLYLLVCTGLLSYCQYIVCLWGVQCNGCMYSC